MLPPWCRRTARLTGGVPPGPTSRRCSDGSSTHHAAHWSLTADQPLEIERRYAPDSLVLESTITTTTGEAVVTDALAM